MSTNIEWLIGEYRNQKNKVIGLQCDVASLIQENERLEYKVACMHIALVKIRDSGKDDQGELGWAADVADKALQQ